MQRKLTALEKSDQILDHEKILHAELCGLEEKYDQEDEHLQERYEYLKRAKAGVNEAKKYFSESVSYFREKPQSEKRLNTMCGDIHDYNKSIENLMTEVSQYNKIAAGGQDLRDKYFQKREVTSKEEKRIRAHSIRNSTLVCWLDFRTYSRRGV